MFDYSFSYLFFTSTLLKIYSFIDGRSLASRFLLVTIYRVFYHVFQKKSGSEKQIESK